MSEGAPDLDVCLPGGPSGFDGRLLAWVVPSGLHVCVARPGEPSMTLDLGPEHVLALGELGRARFGGRP
ncbi:hypothetical protein [Deinococcus apachensis]|uniref:hypothetical protein n=1 Tax=Deinococcus apachensis TaxID=309886 RepID=UPI0003A11EE1|nr:hypothetical protein [Deinococcus apachensis]